MDNSSDCIRVLHVVTKMDRGGLESRIMDIYRNIDRTKIQFDFLTHGFSSGHFDDEIRSLGGRIYDFPPIKPQKFPSYISNLNSFFKDHPEYKIVHAHLNSYCTWVLAAAKKAGVPVRIAHSRNSGLDHNWKAIFKYLSKLFVNLPATHKFACSEQAGEWLFGKKGIAPPNYFRVIPNGFDTKKFEYSEEGRKSARTELGLTDEFAVTNVGSLSLQKNHRFLFEVFKKIVNKRPNAKLYLFGEGSLQNEYEQLVAADDILNGKVVFMGNVTNVGHYLQAMDVMVFPSVYEGFGTAVIETQCSGLPTLASDVLSESTRLTECIEFMSLQSSPEQWADKVLDLFGSIERIDRRAEIKAAGFDINDSYKILSDFYTTVLK